MYSHHQKGYSMLAAMIAVLVFSVMALILMQYLHRVACRQADLCQYRQALALAHQALEGYGVPVLRDRLVQSLRLPADWRLEISTIPQKKGCVSVSAQVTTPRGQRAMLSEWHCLPEKV